MVETQQIHDPNYVLDERGKAHYLFDKKNADGKIQKTFRTHSKHTNSDNAESSTSSSTTNTKAIVPTARKRKVEEQPEEKPKPDTNNKKQSGKRRRRRFQGSDSDENESTFDNDNSGNFSSRAMQDSDPSKRRSKRQRRPTAAAIESMSEGGLSSLYFEPQLSETEDDPTCPLPGFIDPITLEQVVKPAISKYGHVMG